MKAVNLAIESMLPPDLRRPDRIYTKKNLDKLLNEVALQYPDRYADIVKSIADLGRHGSYHQGETLKLSDFRPVIDKDGLLKKMDAEVAQAQAKAKTPAEAEKARLIIWSRYAGDMEKLTTDAALAQHNNLGNTVVSGARGNPTQLKAMVTTPGLYTDYKDKIIPMFVRHSFGEGLRPAEYLASSYGVRKGVISTKSCLHEGTLVRMANGKTKRIEKIIIGDRVLGADLSGRCFPKTVTAKWNQGLQPCEKYSYQVNGSKQVIELVATSEHPILVSFNRHAIFKIKIGHKHKKLFAVIAEPKESDDAVHFAKRLPVEDAGMRQCWDITVDSEYHLFVLANGMIVSNSTAEGGDMLKQMNSALASTVVTTDDCGTNNGLDYDTDDPEIEGRVAAKDYGDIKVGDVLDHRKIAKLQRQGVKKIIVRSPMTCQAKEGICAHCLGTLHNGKMAPIGYSAGVTAAAAIGEPRVQGALNTKHLSGAFKGGKKQFSGTDIVDQIMQSPETFPHKAPVAEESGRVENVEDAPQGGKFITVAGHKHYALPGYEPLVKTNDQVEKGDTLSEGIADVSDIVRLRGLGEGRRYYVDRLRQAMTESGLPTPSRLNLETLARGVLDHVRVDNKHGLGDLLPDDIGSYNKLSASYHSPADTKLVPTGQAHGHYLQGPALHYSIGTHLTPKMTKHLEEAGISHVPVSDQQPDFVPEMQRLRAVTHNNPDWYSRLHSSYLTTTLSEAGDRSRDADFESNVHFAGPLSKGKDFGKKVNKTGKF